MGNRGAVDGEAGLGGREMWDEGSRAGNQRQVIGSQLIASLVELRCPRQGPVGVLRVLVAFDVLEVEGAGQLVNGGKDSCFDVRLREERPPGCNILESQRSLNAFDDTLTVPENSGRVGGL